MTLPVVVLINQGHASGAEMAGAPGCPPGDPGGEKPSPGTVLNEFKLRMVLFYYWLPRNG
jgi:hypothetical protein